jgi:ABC-type dipeptide/oligopeptide/nickel transport system permease component
MTSEPKQETKDKVATKIANGIIRFQQFISERMNRCRYLKIILILFCVTSLSLSVFFIVEAIISKPKQTTRPHQMYRPQQEYEPSEDIYDESIPEEIYLDIQAYKKYADSIGEVIRPGLADSMRILEEMYLQQQK